MAQKLWRVVRACVELGPDNPIQQIHDQGAGGNCNVVSAAPACKQPSDSTTWLKDEACLSGLAYITLPC